MQQELEKILGGSGMRVTTPRREVFGLLERVSSPLSQVEIAAMLPNVDRVTVYRVIDLFLKLGVVTSVTFGWKQKYELAEPFRPHHHHLHCQKCGKIEVIHSKKIEKAIADIADGESFHVTGHLFELTGFCAACQSVKLSK